MAKNKGQYLLDGTFQQWLDIEAYHKGSDTFDLAIDETDGLLYLQINGQNVGEGVEVTGGGGSVVRYNVSYTIPHVTSSNASTKIIEGRTFTTKLTADQDFEIKSVTVTMGSVAVPNAYNAETGIVTVSNVTGDLAIVVVSKALVIFNEVQWLDTAYGIGDNSVSAYNGWCPGCAKYDETLGKVIFLQCHSTAHAGNFTKSQLWAIDPYNVMDNPVLLHEFPVVSNVVPLCFDIYNDVYYVVSKNRVYTSSDHGQTWTENSVVTAPARAYALKIIDDVMYVGDDAMNDANIGLYYTSTDGGLNWQTNKFDFADEYGSVLNCSEAEFIKFNGRLYASIRRTDLTGLLAVLDNGVWTVISETLPNVNSDCFLFATDSDVIAFAAIDRPNTTIKLGTITIDPNDNVTVTTNKSLNIRTASGDFHTPTYVVGSDFHMVTFMLNGGFGTEYRAANNVAMVGYTDLSVNQNPSYTAADFSASQSHIAQTPYAGENPYPDGTLNIQANKTIVNLTEYYENTHPLSEDGKVVFYAPNIKSWNKYGTSSYFDSCAYDSLNYNGAWYACLVKENMQNSAFNGIKQMYKAIEIKSSVSADDLGGIVPADGVFTHAFLPAQAVSGGNASRWSKRYRADIVRPENVNVLTEV